MNSKIISNNKTRPFAKIRMILSTFLSIDISDDNSGLDSYINNSNIQSEEDKENARIAQELKNSLSSIDSRIVDMEKSSKTTKKSKRSSTTLSLKTEPSKISSEVLKGENIHTISMKDDRDLSL